VLGRLRDWSDHDVYLAGPPAMISKSVALLQDLGVPPDRLRHDPLDVGR
jgi:NAD(P)H-flavin reductase